MKEEMEEAGEEKEGGRGALLPQASSCQSPLPLQGLPVTQGQWELEKDTERGPLHLPPNPRLLMMGAPAPRSAVVSVVCDRTQTWPRSAPTPHSGDSGHRGAISEGGFTPPSREAG